MRGYKKYLTTFFICFCLFNFCLLAQEQDKIGNNLKPDIYFSYTSNCNIAIQIKDNLVTLIFEGEHCIQRVDSLRLIKDEERVGLSYNIVDEYGNIYYTIFIHDENENQIDLFNNYILESFDENAQLIGDENEGCEKGNVIIKLWTDLNSEDKISEMKFYLKQGNINEYVKKIRFLLSIGLQDNAQLIAKIVIDQYKDNNELSKLLEIIEVERHKE